MKSLIVEPGEYISPDVGLSDETKVRVSDDAGNAIHFDFEPREWLAEWELVRRTELPAGATYSRLLPICASRFHVHFTANADGERFWELTVFDILSRTDRKVTLSEREMESLAGKVRQGLNR